MEFHVCREAKLVHWAKLYVVMFAWQAVQQCRQPCVRKVCKVKAWVDQPWLSRRRCVLEECRIACRGGCDERFRGSHRELAVTLDGLT